MIIPINSNSLKKLICLNGDPKEYQRKKSKSYFLNSLIKNLEITNLSYNIPIDNFDEIFDLILQLKSGYNIEENLKKFYDFIFLNNNKFSLLRSNNIIQFFFDIINHNIPNFNDYSLVIKILNLLVNDKLNLLYFNENIIYFLFNLFSKDLSDSIINSLFLIIDTLNQNKIIILIEDNLLEPISKSLINFSINNSNFKFLKLIIEIEKKILLYLTNNIIFFLFENLNDISIIIDSTELKIDFSSSKEIQIKLINLFHNEFISKIEFIFIFCNILYWDEGFLVFLQNDFEIINFLESYFFDKTYKFIISFIFSYFKNNHEIITNLQLWEIIETNIIKKEKIRKRIDFLMKN